MTPETKQLADAADKVLGPTTPRARSPVSSTTTPLSPHVFSGVDDYMLRASPGIDISKLNIKTEPLNEDVSKLNYSLYMLSIDSCLCTVCYYTYCFFRMMILLYLLILCLLLLSLLKILKCHLKLLQFSLLAHHFLLLLLLLWQTLLFLENLREFIGCIIKSAAVYSFLFMMYLCSPMFIIFSKLLFSINFDFRYY